MFVKCEAKPTLIEKFATTLDVEKDLLSIVSLKHDSQDETKPSTKKNKASTSKPIDKDKDSFDFEGLAKSFKQLTE